MCWTKISPGAAVGLIALAMAALTPRAASAACPLHASQQYEANNVVHCKCDAGYENREGACRPVPTIRRRPEPVMRARPNATLRAPTKAECLRLAAADLRTALASCRTPLLRCVMSAGVRINEAGCAVSALFTALVVAADPTKVSAVAAGLMTAGAAGVCAKEAYDALEKCTPDWGACPNAPLQKHKDAVATCPAK